MGLMSVKASEFLPFKMLVCLGGCMVLALYLPGKVAGGCNEMGAV